MGMKLLSSALVSLYSFEWYEDYSVDEDYWTWMNYGSLQPLYPSPTADGPVTITAQDPVIIQPGESVDVWYAMALGANEQNMLDRMAEAVDQYEEIFVGIGDKGPGENELNLSQNFPNPLSQSTRISYQLPDDGFVSLKVFDAIGNEVTTLIEKEQARGSYGIDFNASDLPTGVYYYTLRFNSQVRTKIMFVTR
jgi:hypothetical protein